ncbi:hypothetical protein ACFLXD_06040, partial [Chloroflexota bacterium]
MGWYVDKIRKLKGLPNPYALLYVTAKVIGGKSFLVCVDKAPIYWGAFWTPISSMSFDGVTIWKPLGSQESKLITL